MSQVLELYKSTGNEVFSKMIAEAAPYFSTIEPVFKELRPGYAELGFPNQKKVHNHIGTVHAIAMCNAAELVAGTMTDVSIPGGHRWIPVAMSVKYLAMAKTDLRAVADGSHIDWNREGDIDVPVTLYDTDGQAVFTAVITMKVSRKKKA
ncbi:MAG: DUF4442 domain-containing protein [Proteobacteria bacterium]|nr:DUF4442 domain-containing protein [Pseudomonadota bacterium]